MAVWFHLAIASSLKLQQPQKTGMGEGDIKDFQILFEISIGLNGFVKILGQVKNSSFSSR